MDVCFCFLQRNDFNGLAAVYTGGLSSAAIYRLKKTTGIFTYKDDERVPRDDFESNFDQALAEKYETVKLAMSTDKNFTSYRQRWVLVVFGSSTTVCSLYYAQAGEGRFAVLPLYGPVRDRRYFRLGRQGAAFFLRCKLCRRVDCRVRSR